MKLSFLGATQTVTGSKYLLESRGKRILIDCGLFQGLKELRLRNWSSLPIDPRSIDAVILTHAHLDHSGYLPLLVKNGFRGNIYCTAATRDLCEILLVDSGFLQEEDARRANKYSYSKHKPALALYTEADAHRALEHFVALDFEKTYHIDNKIFFKFRPAGHILGAAFVRIDDTNTSITFSGDIGRQEDPLMFKPASLEDSDYVVVESTYGDRLHSQDKVEDELATIITESSRRGGSILIASFAVGRAQSILYYIHKLQSLKRIPELPVYLDSPMATSATELFCKYHLEHKLNAKESREVCDTASYIQNKEESKRISNPSLPSIIISASGMATGGRILHHLKTMLPNHRNSIVFAGFQAAGTRGRDLVEGAKEIRIHGENYKVRAKIHCLDSASAHADYKELLVWLRTFPGAPKQTFITHGEESASAALQEQIETEFAWHCTVPKYLSSYEL